MRNSGLRQTDRQTDREKSALVELRFAAKKRERGIWPLGCDPLYLLGRNTGGQKEGEHGVGIFHHVQGEQRNILEPQRILKQ